MLGLGLCSSAWLHLVPKYRFQVHIQSIGPNRILTFYSPVYGLIFSQLHVQVLPPKVLLLVEADVTHPHDKLSRVTHRTHHAELSQTQE